MAEVRFLSVGQGDSILIKDESLIGIIDCKSYKGLVPTIEILKSEKISSIDFIVWSHPHLDHFSGFFDLLNYCVDRKIRIDKFYMALLTTQEVIDAVTLEISTRRKIIKLLMLINNLYEEGLINKCGNIDDLTGDIIGTSTEFNFLLPTKKTYNQFIKANYNQKNGKLDFKNNANLLSSVILMNEKQKDKVGVFTADSEKESLDGLYRKVKTSKSKIIFGQIPHHGSYDNHSPKFWNNFLLGNCEKAVAVISVGRKNKYGHPSNEVIEYFNKKKLVVKTTIPSEARSNTSNDSISFALDMMSVSSHRDENYSANNDVIVEF